MHVFRLCKTRSSMFISWVVAFLFYVPFTLGSQPLHETSHSCAIDGLSTDTLGLCPYFGGVGYQASFSFETETEEAIPRDEVWVVRPSPGKGRGVFAAQDIARGTHIMEERPLFTGYAIADMTSDIETEFAQLSAEQQTEYLSCHEHKLQGEPESGRLLRILRSNAYTTQEGRIAIYPKVALINHSCQPNVLNADNQNTRIIIAMRDIVKGEEIFTTYIPLLMHTADRNQRLYQYGFQCQCEACKTSESDPRRQQAGMDLKELETALGTGLSKADKQSLTAKAEELARYVEKEGFADYFTKTSNLVVHYAKLAGLKGKARRWARKSLDHHSMIDEDSADSQRAAEILASI
ncbi:hypothetical protein B0I35DRAFT_446122 [Stachybotrys elegans]|uniref:SET domain-containing protein n=1 Tax=Stachybotrys elegans TaxID=80388 RepID=A0A8K0SCF6_9HYPO|nr:hypothetical protein B0I35DRAFT_446122 [Stachybotrys elegans]